MCRQAGDMDYRVGILGLLELYGHDGRPIELRGQLRRRLLLELAAARGSTVVDADLIDHLWPDGPPRHASASLRNMVADLRRHLGSTAIERTGLGYRLEPGTTPLDLDVFELLVDEARARLHVDDLGGAVTCLDRALELVRGDPFDEVADQPWARATARAVDEQIALVEEFWADLRLRSAHVGREIERLRRAAHRQPHRELRWRQLLSAFAMVGRRTEALRAADEARRSLAQYGVEPSPALIELEQTILDVTNDERRDTIPVRRNPIAGRFEQLRQLREGHRISWITGAAGSGKSRLVAEHADRTRASGRPVVYVGVRDRPVAASEVLIDAFDGLATTDRDTMGTSLDARDRLATLLHEIDAAGGCDVILDDVDHIDAGSAEIVRYIATVRYRGVRWILTASPNRNPATARLEAIAERLGCAHIDVGPLDRTDLEQLAADLAPDASRDAVGTHIDEVIARTNGHATLASELLADRLAGSSEPVPRRVACLVTGELAAMSDSQQLIVELLAVSPGAVPHNVIACAAELGIEDVLRDIDALVFEGMVYSPAEAARFQHGLVHDAVLASLPRATVERNLRRLVDAFVIADTHPVEFARFLVEGAVPRSLGSLELVDRTVRRAFRHLELTGEHSEAGTLAGHYVDLTRHERMSLDALRTHVEAARCLIAVGQVRRGRALLRSLLPAIQQLDDPTLHADAILALGPVETGGSEQSADMFHSAERLADQLRGDTSRRVQLLSWAAHQQVNSGRRTEALNLLREADASIDDPRPTWAGLVLAVRAQAETLIGSGPGAARRSYERLNDFGNQTGDLSTLAAAAVLAPGRSFADGTLDDVRGARNRLADLAAHLPRPDITWLLLAIDGALALAVGDLDVATEAITRAEEEGEHLQVAMSRSSALVQRFALSLQADQLTELVPLLEPSSATPTASATMLAAYGLAAARAGDEREAAAAANRLATMERILPTSGMAWPQLAMIGSDLAFATEHRDLARSIECDLAPYSGTGLAVGGIAYFGSANRSLAMLAATLGETSRASDLAERAYHEEIARGARAWTRPLGHVADLVEDPGAHRPTTELAGRSPV